MYLIAHQFFSTIHVRAVFLLKYTYKFRKVKLGKIIDNVAVITLDGPSGTGKGTISQKLAHHLGWHYLDSGAIYRVLAYVASSKKTNFEDVNTLVYLAHHLDLRFEVDEDLNTRIFSEGNEITSLIRTEECGQNASKIAAIPEVRKALLARQRSFAVEPGLVTDGRDMGTVVFPDAKLKIFLHASPEARANRRLLQLNKKQNGDNLAQVIDQLAERDARDSQRTCAPLTPAIDAIAVDTTQLSVDQVFAKVLELVEQNAILVS